MKHIFILITCWSLWGCDAVVNEQRLSLHGLTMGTSYQIDIIKPEKIDIETELANGIEHRLTTIENQMSNWREDSEISIFNRLPVDRYIEVSANTFEVITLSQSISKLTEGAFDITISPLIELWGFGANKTVSVIPDKDQINEARARIGYQYLTLIPESRFIKKNRPITLNVSAIAKGYAVDEIAEYLIEHGISRFMVEIGGEIRAHGLKNDNSRWKIAIEQPDYIGSTEQRNAKQIVTLMDKAIATSGDYRNYFVVDDQRYSHIINPKTGWPVKHGLVSVSVIDQSAARADALATAFTVMGTEKSLVFGEKHNIAAYFITQEQGQFKQYMTPTFQKHLTNDS